LSSFFEVRSEFSGSRNLRIFLEQEIPEAIRLFQLPPSNQTEIFLFQFEGVQPTAAESSFQMNHGMR